MKKTRTTISKAEFAEAQDISRSMVTKLVARGLPVTRDRRIDPIAAEKWLANYRAPRHGKPETLSEVLLRKERALAGLRELELAIKSGEAVAISDFEGAMSQTISTARSRLLLIPSSLAPAVAAESDPAACQELIRVEIYDALTELASGKERKNQKEKNDEENN